MKIEKSKQRARTQSIAVKYEDAVGGARVVQDERERMRAIQRDTFLWTALRYHFISLITRVTENSVSTIEC